MHFPLVPMKSAYVTSYKLL